MKKRNEFVDELRGYACFLIVVFHVILGIRKAAWQGIYIPHEELFFENYFNSFHVALFMFISGFVYKYTGGWERKKSKYVFLRNKFIDLAVPYFFFSIIYIIINSLFSSSVNTEFELIDILKIWRTPVAQYWFLYTLFFIFLFFVLIDGRLDKKIVISILFVIAFFRAYYKINLGPFSSFFTYAGIFGVGSMIENLKVKKLGNWWKAFIFMISLGAFFLSFYFSVNEVWVIGLLLKFIGIYGSIQLISLIDCTVIKKILLFISRYSFHIYLLHTIFTSAIRILLIKMSIYNYYIHTIIGILVGILIPCIIGFISSKYSILNFVFAPTHVITKLREQKNN